MKPIGGYFELELNPGREYHRQALRVNLGRAAFEYILRARRADKVLMPYYTCGVMVQTVKRLGLDLEFYGIDGQLEPLLGHKKPIRNEYLLYTNYFGLKDVFIRRLTRAGWNLIIDNAQAFYSKPITGADTFYSPRKFFGVPDGAYLYTDAVMPGSLERDHSAGRFGHLIGRLENGAEAAYHLFQDNERALNEQPLMLMSVLTQRLLQSIDYARIARLRRSNFVFLHRQLHQTNRLAVALTGGAVPMVYPYLSDRPGLRQILIRNKVFTARYWPEVVKWSARGSLEQRLADNLLALPIDQRYGKNELKEICTLIGGRCHGV